MFFNHRFQNLLMFLVRMKAMGVTTMTAAAAADADDADDFHPGIVRPMAK